MDHISTATDQIRKRLENLDTRPLTSQSSECPDCKGTGWQHVDNGVKRCECARKRIQEAQNNALPHRFRNSSFQNYIPGDEAEVRALEIVKSETGGLYIWGRYGHGKTHLAAAQYRAMVAAGQSCAWRSMADLLEELRDYYNRDKFSIVMERAKYSEGWHLFVDDFDKYKPSEWTSQAMHQLFDLLYSRKLTVTITSNFGLEALEELGKLDSSVKRRIDEMCRVVEV